MWLYIVGERRLKFAVTMKGLHWYGYLVVLLDIVLAFANQTDLSRLPHPLFAKLY